MTLDPVVKDNHGLPVPLITSTHFQNGLAMINAISTKLREILEAAGAREIPLENVIPGNSSHYLVLAEWARHKYIGRGSLVPNA